MQALVVGDRWPDTMATHRASLRPARPMTWQGRKGLATDALASSPPRNATITGRRVDLTRRPCCVGPTIGTPAKLDRALPRISFEKSGGDVWTVFEVIITKRSQTKWEWRVCDRQGTPIMKGFEGTRRAAKYKATERCSCYWRLAVTDNRSLKGRSLISTQPHAGRDA